MTNEADSILEVFEGSTDKMNKSIPESAPMIGPIKGIRLNTPAITPTKIIYLCGILKTVQTVWSAIIDKTPRIVAAINVPLI